MGTDFYAVLDQGLALLRSRGRVTYNALQLQFNLDDAHLAVLKEELLYAHPQVVDDAGRGLIWPRDEHLLAPQRVAHSAVLRFYEDLVSALLQREGRLSYSTGAGGTGGRKRPATPPLGAEQSRAGTGGFDQR